MESLESKAIVSPLSRDSAMEITGQRLIPVAQAQVWDALNEPDVLKVCIPGCESMEAISDTELRVVVTAAIGPVKAKFAGKLLLADVNPPNSYRLSFEGSGGPAGFGNGDALVRLTPEGAGTRLSYQANARIGGKLAQIGSRLIDGVAKKMVDEFFQRFTVKLAGLSMPAAGKPPLASTTKSTGPSLEIAFAFALIVTAIVFINDFVLIWLLR